MTFVGDIADGETPKRAFLLYHDDRGGAWKAAELACVNAPTDKSWQRRAAR